MEGTLRVTPEQLEAAATEFSAKGTTMSNLTSQMSQLVGSLSGVWEGEAAATYTGQFRQLEDDIQRISRMVQEHAADLNEMARVYRGAETANQEEAAGLAGDIIH
mgnify:CR=1 FL=1